MANILNKYKVAFFDIDGTLVSFKTHEVPESTRRAIEFLRANGIRCFISSGRHLGNIDNLGDLEFDGYVTVNGGMTYMDGKLIDANPIDKSDIHRTIEIIYPTDNSPKGIEPYAVSFVLRDGLVMNYENEKTEFILKQLNFKTRPTIMDLRNVADCDVFQMISFFDTDVEASILKELPHCQSARWSPVFTDLIPLGQSKVRGIDIVCQKIGVDASAAIAFGDGGNDIEMLSHVGMGIAMGNAVDAVKAKAKFVCPSVDEDGILFAAEKIISGEL